MSAEPPAPSGGEQGRARLRLQSAKDERDRLQDEQAGAETPDRLGADVRLLAAEDEMAARTRWLEWADAQEAIRSDWSGAAPGGRWSP
jgi:hypothetical protein